MAEHMVTVERLILVTPQQFAQIIARSAVTDQLTSYMRDNFDLQPGQRYTIAVIYDA